MKHCSHSRFISVLFLLSFFFPLCVETRCSSDYRENNHAQVINCNMRDALVCILKFFKNGTMLFNNTITRA